MPLKLNSDLGESFGAWKMGLDEAIMPHINQANIACGFHAGDPVVMQKTILLAKEHNVIIGAHAGYPDLVGFGRRSIKTTAAELRAMLHYQIAAIDGMAANEDMILQYVKPHGAMYNDMMANEDIRKTIMHTLADYHRPLVLMLQSTPQAEIHAHEALSAGIPLWFEVFADRCYDDDGYLLSRNIAGAVHSRDKMLAQAEQLKQQGTVTTLSGKQLELKADTLCVHGDNPEAINAIKQIRELIK